MRGSLASMMRGLCVFGLVCAIGCGGGGGGGPDGGGDDVVGDDAPDAPPGGDGFAADYPGDAGICGAPAVVWCEDFSAGDVGTIAGRYDQVQGQGRMTVVDEQPPGTAGQYALAMRAGGGVDAVDLYKQLPSADEWYVRWYAKYEADVPWHHSGVWFGGYNPAMPYPSPQAGYRPNGDERFSISIEPVFYEPSPRFDYYNYWRGMHTWMDEPVNNNGTAYYGNPLVHRQDFTIDEDQWVCVEVHVRLNTAGGSAAGAQLDVWKNDALVMGFDETGPLGYWIRDKFCTEAGNGNECTDYPRPFDTILDLEFRSTTDLALNAFWPQNYITSDEQGTLTFDQMVVATERIGCLR
jgi:hypothetical protein